MGLVNVDGIARKIHRQMGRCLAMAVSVAYVIGGWVWAPDHSPIAAAVVIAGLTGILITALLRNIEKLRRTHLAHPAVLPTTLRLQAVEFVLDDIRRQAGPEVSMAVSAASMCVSEALARSLPEAA